VRALWIVEHLDVVEHILPSFFACSVGPSSDPLTLQQVKGALSVRVIIAVPTAAHRVLQVVGSQERRPVHAGELAALVRVDQLTCHGSFIQQRPESGWYLRRSA